MPPVKAHLLQHAEETEGFTKSHTESVSSEGDFSNDVTEYSSHPPIFEAIFYNSDDEDASLSEMRGKNWRRNWFVRTFLTDIPIVGYFFRVPNNCTNTVYFSVKSVFKLAVGAASMVFVPVEQAESVEARIFKLTTALVIGKAVGGMIYNTVGIGMRALYEYCLKNHLISLLSGDNDVEVESVNNCENESAVNNEAKGWRNNWLGNTIFTDIPVIGHFFRHAKCRDARYFAGKSVCELAVGGIAMALAPVGSEETGREKALIARFGAAVVGMYAGGVVYKAAGSACSCPMILYRACLKQKERLLARTIEKDDIFTATTGSGISLQGS
ncbi:MAG TPA: hypothetical protein VNK03_04920 [Gammaproteobacteria bacterium]|nr:hypothetical protein [Gammaproteobacteria bacterium]